MQKRISADQLKIKALLALFELVESADIEPLPGTRSLRFLLAYLFNQTKGERTPFDEFWKFATASELHASPGVTGVHRRMELDFQFARISMQVGEHREMIRQHYRALLAAADGRRESAVAASTTSTTPDEAA